MVKVNKAVGLLCKLCNILPRTTLITIYKAFIWWHLDYGDVQYDQAFSNSFKEKLESFQYNACLTLTGAVRDTSKEKIYQYLGLESLRDPHWFRKLVFFIRSWKKKILNIYSAWFLPDTRYTQLEIYIISPLSQLFQKRFFHNWMEQARSSS